MVCRLRVEGEGGGGVVINVDIPHVRYIPHNMSEPCQAGVRDW